MFTSKNKKRLMIAVSLIALMVVGLVIGCADTITGNEKNLTGSNGSNLSKMNFAQYSASEYFKMFDQDKLINFSVQNFNTTRSVDIESIIMLLIDNLPELVDDDSLNEIIKQAAIKYGVTLNDSDLLTTLEIVQSYFDVRNEFGGINLISSNVGQTVTNLRANLLDESRFTTSDIVNLSGVFSAISEGNNTVDDILSMLYMAQVNTSLSSNYLAFVNSAINTFESYENRNKSLSSYFDIATAAMDMISSSDDDDGGTQILRTKVWIYIEITKKSITIYVEVQSE